MENIKNQRLRLVVTQLRLLNLIKHDSDFAEQIGWDRSSLSSTYNGKRPVSDKLISCICNHFDFVNPKYLSGEENTMLLEYPDLSVGNFLICEEGDAPEIVRNDGEDAPALKARIAELEEQCRRKEEEIAWLRGLVEKLTAR